MTNPRISRSIWGLRAANHLMRSLAKSNDVPAIRTRMRLHGEAMTTHSKAGLTCLDTGLEYSAALHINAACAHAEAVRYLYGILANSLTSKEIVEMASMIDKAVDAGLLAVDKTKEANGAEAG